MLFDMYTPRVISNLGLDKNNPNRDYSAIHSILAQHSEIPRPEYNYAWNSDGIRSVELSTKPKVIAIGCSITLGQGLPVENRWSNQLENMLKPHGDYTVGNISYSGAAINKNISSFFGLINQYKYLPEYVICHFAGFERFYFVDGMGTTMRDWYSNYSKKTASEKAPWNYEAILPFEWVYYNNLDHIKMLESFCDATGIKLIWSTWSNSLTLEQETFIKNNFRHYVEFPMRKDFPPDFEFLVSVDDPNKLEPYYKMHKWDEIQCHLDLYNENKDIFHHAYDYHKIAGSWGPGAHWPHPGSHQQRHIAEFYYNKMEVK